MANASIPADTYTLKQPKLSVVRAKRIFFENDIYDFSETGRFPMYFSIILSIVKYLHRLENASNALIKEAYCLSKVLNNKGIQTWYTSAIYIFFNC